MDEQFGFRKCLNTEMPVFDLVENIRLSIETCEIYLAFFIDFSTAFNCLHSSYILSCWLGSGLSKHSALDIADSFSGGFLWLLDLMAHKPLGIRLTEDLDKGSMAGEMLRARLYRRCFIPVALVTCLQTTRLLKIAVRCKICERLWLKQKRALSLSRFGADTRG